jgi:hypothetical protein
LHKNVFSFEVRTTNWTYLRMRTYANMISMHVHMHAHINPLLGKILYDSVSNVRTRMHAYLIVYQQFLDIHRDNEIF